MSAEAIPVKEEEQMVLSCEIPDSATPGSTFHVQVSELTSILSISLIVVFRSLKIDSSRY